MTGHEIAEELRNTKYQWRRHLIAHRNAEEDATFCVLGIKALEHGATVEQVFRASEDWCTEGPSSDDRNKLTLTRPIWKINDAYETKEAVIAEFDHPDNHDKQFPVEEFVEWVKSL